MGNMAIIVSPLQMRINGITYVKEPEREEEFTSCLFKTHMHLQNKRQKKKNVIYQEIVTGAKDNTSQNS